VVEGKHRGQRAHWLIATRWLRVSPGRCAGECEAVDGCDRHGDAGEEL